MGTVLFFSEFLSNTSGHETTRSQLLEKHEMCFCGIWCRFVDRLRAGFTPSGGDMFIDRGAKNPSGSVRRSGIQLELHHCRSIPLLRTELAPAFGALAL